MWERVFRFNIIVFGDCRGGFFGREWWIDWVGEIVACAGNGVREDLLVQVCKQLLVGKEEF